jgi:preprotein translocase subunit SecE
MEIVIMEPIKKADEEEERISNFIKSISKTEEELNVVILPSRKNLMTMK